MKKAKLLILALISLLLPSCSNTPNNPNNQIISDENTKLSNIIEKPKNEISENQNTSIKTPASGYNSSGEKIQNSNEGTVNTDENLQSEVKISLRSDPLPTKELLGSYSSKVYTKTADRQKNLRIVCDKLSGTILAPNQEFSYNDTCGPYNKESGFGKATVFVGNGIEKQDYGGGVCQLSSTLYNAVKKLNIEITERHNHSKKVYYVPDGQDATVSYGHLDFKFKNLNNYSLLFQATSNAQTVNVYVYKA